MTATRQEGTDSFDEHVLSLCAQSVMTRSDATISTQVREWSRIRKYWFTAGSIPLLILQLDITVKILLCFPS